MKRLVLILIVVAALVGAALYFFCCRGAAGTAGFVPADTVLYLSLPDMKRSGERWDKTALAQIGADPAVADFLAQPLALLNKGGATEAREILNKLDPKSMFFAITTVSRTGAQVVLGVEYSGARKDLDDAMARLYSEVGKKFPTASQSTADYKGDTVTALTAGKPVMFTAAHGQWVFLSNNEGVLQQTLDRAARRGGSTPALSGNGDYKKVLGHLAASPDFVWYAQPKTLVDLLIEVGKAQGEMTEKQFAQVRKITGLGGSLVFDGESQKEAMFILYPGAPKYDVINHSPMAFTTPGTSIFFDSAMDKQTVSSDDYIQSLPPEAQAFFKEAKIDLKQMPQILGTDIGFLLEWPTSALIPNALVTIEIKDRAAAQNLVQAALTGFGLDARASESHGAAVYHFTGTQLVEPSIAVTDKFVLGSLSAAEMDRALSLQAGTPTLESTAAFKPALASYGKAGIAFGFVDIKALFERIYNMVRPMAVIAGSMSPEVAQVIDVKKIPETSAISSHLSPILYSSDQTSDGILIESSGPITLSQAFAIVIAGGAGAFAAQMGGGMH